MYCITDVFCHYSLCQLERHVNLSNKCRANLTVTRNHADRCGGVVPGHYPLLPGQQGWRVAKGTVPDASYETRTRVPMFNRGLEAASLHAKALNRSRETP